MYSVMYLCGIQLKPHEICVFLSVRLVYMVGEAEFLSPLDEISTGPFLPKAQFTVFPPSTQQGWVVMENWLKKSISTWSQGGNG